MTLPGTTVQIDSTVLDYLRRLKDTGRRAWLDTPTPAGDCGNCGGSGRLLIQVSDDGPFDSPLNLRGATHVADVGWFSSHTETIPCPACSRWTQRFEQSGLLAQEYDWNIEYLRGRGGRGAPTAPLMGCWRSCRTCAASWPSTGTMAWARRGC